MNRTGGTQGQIAGVRHERGSIGIGGDATNRRGKELRENWLKSDLFISLASHNLQSPLRIVSGYCKLLVEMHAKQLDVESQLRLRNVIDGAEPMQSLVKGLFADSRIGGGGEARRPVSCELIVDQAVSSLEMESRVSSAIITRDPLPVVVADVAELTIVIQPLVHNAIKYGRKLPPRIDLAAEKDTGACIFHVRDSGSENGPEELEVVFTLLNRLGAGAAQPRKGIGPANCKRVVEQHGGSVWVESQPGVGSTFYFSIPRTDNRISLSNA
jgi:light-regulated signal transduction histidine kinase (bacteriophytochrome)